MKTDQKLVFITHNNACDKRLLDCFRLIPFFELNGFAITDDPGQANYLIFMTCAFHGEKEADCFRILSELRRYPGQIIVLGCLKKIAEEKVQREFQGIVLGTTELDRIDELFPGCQFKFADIPDANRFHRPQSLIPGTDSHGMTADGIKIIGGDLVFDRFKDQKAESDKAFIRISRGCINKCAYCAIRKAIGSLNSKPLSDCIAEYEKMIASGYKNIVFLAEDAGSYGMDIGTSLPELLRRASAIPAPGVLWKLVDIHPRWVIQYQEELLSYIEAGRIQEFCCCIQSGSDRILNLMNRCYQREDLRQVLIKFKKSNPRFKLTTHVIVGYPSESGTDFDASIDFIRDPEIGIDEIGIMPYSDRPGTVAAELPDKIAPEVIRERIRRITRIIEQDQKIYYSLNNLLVADKTLLLPW